MCFNSSAVLIPRDARGMTPFMSAVSGRAYPAAITILETAQKIAKGTPVSVITSLWFPSKVRHVGRFIINSAFLSVKLHVLEQQVMVVNNSFQNTVYCFMFWKYAS